MKAKIRDTEIFFDVNGCNFSYHDGKLIERPVVFCLHGTGMDHSSFKKHSMALVDCAQLVMLDYRGCGRSLKGDKNTYTLENNIEDIEALRQYLGLEKICVLGISYGGTVAQGYALKYQQHINKLIIAVSAPNHTFLDFFNKQVSQLGTPEQIAYCQKVMSGGLTSEDDAKEYMLVMASLFNKSFAKNAQLSKPDLENLSVSYEAINQAFKTDLQHFDYTDQLFTLTVPTLIMAGKNDITCPVELCALTAEKIQNSKFVIFENSGHTLASDENEKYAKTVREFLR